MSTLRGSADDEGRVPVSYRLPSDVVEYIAAVAKGMGRDKTEVVASALELDRDLASKLDDLASRLRAFAEENGLSMKRDLGEVLARLVRLGVEAHELGKKARR